MKGGEKEEEREERRKKGERKGLNTSQVKCTHPNHDLLGLLRPLLACHWLIDHLVPHIGHLLLHAGLINHTYMGRQLLNS